MNDVFTGNPIEDRLAVQLDDAQELTPIGTENQFLEDLLEATKLLVEQAIVFIRETNNRNSFSTRETGGAIPEREKQFFDAEYWINLFLATNTEIFKAIKINTNIPVEFLEASPYARQQTTAAVLNYSLARTIMLAQHNGKSNHGSTRTAIDMLSRIMRGPETTKLATHPAATDLKTLPTEIQADITDSQETFLTIFETQEKWKQILNNLLGFNRDFRFDLLDQAQLQQLEQGVKDILAIIDKLRLQRFRQIEKHQRKIDSYWGRLDSLGDAEGKHQFWRLVSYAAQNPERFILNNHILTGFPDWQDISGCEYPEDFLDVISFTYFKSIQADDSTPNGQKSITPNLLITEHSFLDRVGMMQVHDRLDHTVKEQMNQVATRSESFRDIIDQVGFESVKNWLEANNIGVSNNIEVDQIPDLQLLVQRLVSALAQPQIGIDAARSIYPKNMPRLSPAERFTYLIDFLGKSLNDRNREPIMALLDDDSKQKLLDYLFVFDAISQERFISGGVSEQISVQVRQNLIDTVKSYYELAHELVENILPTLNKTLRSNSGASFTKTIQTLKSFVATAKDIETYLDTQDADQIPLRKRILPSEREVIENFERLAPLVQELETMIPTIESARQQFLEIKGNAPSYSELTRQRKYEEALQEALVGSVREPAHRNTTGIMVQGEGDSPEESLQKSLSESRQITTQWELNRQALLAFTFPIPANAPSYEQALKLLSTSLEKADNLLPEISDNMINDAHFNFDARMKRHLGDIMGTFMEKTYFDKYLINYAQQWEILCKMPEGFMLKEMVWADTTNNDSIVNLASGYTESQTLKKLRLVSNSENTNGSRILVFENENLVIHFLEPDFAVGLGNAYLYQKKGNEVGTLTKNRNFRNALDNYDQSGTVMTSLPYNPSEPATIRDLKLE